MTQVNSRAVKPIIQPVGLQNAKILIFKSRISESHIIAFIVWLTTHLSRNVKLDTHLGRSKALNANPEFYHCKQDKVYHGPRDTLFNESE